MVQKSYLDFILEKRENDLLELLNESLFIMSSKMGEIINDLYNDDDDYSSEFYSFSCFCFGQKGIRMVEIYLVNFRVDMLDNVDLSSNEKVDL